MVDVSDIKELINYSEVLCDNISDMPSGCDGCWLYDEIEDFECPLKKIITKIKENL